MVCASAPIPAEELPSLAIPASSSVKLCATSDVTSIFGVPPSILTSGAPAGALLTLQSGQGHASNDVLLEEEVDDDDRQDPERGAGQDVVVVGAVVALQCEERQRQREHVALAQHQQRPEQVVPMGDEDEDREGR